MKNKIVKSRDKIEVSEDGNVWHPAVVLDPLSSQFTAVAKGTKKLGFYFYLDKGVTWRTKA